MRSRYVLSVVLLLTFFSPLSTASAASLAQQRSLYDQAKLALSKNDATPYLNNRAALRDYL